jgi:hypothetical protein
LVFLLVFLFPNSYTILFWEYFIYWSNKYSYCIFKTCCIVSIICPTKFCLFHNFILFWFM